MNSTCTLAVRPRASLRRGGGAWLRVAPVCVLAACASTLSYPSVERLRFETEVEYVEVRALVPATENALVPLGPGRSYWFEGSDGSRWASDLPTVPPYTRIVILEEGVGLIFTAGRTQLLRHVGGPRNVKRGWYGRVVEERRGPRGVAEVMLEDGRRFEVTTDRGRRETRIPYEVVLSDDATRIFVLIDGVELEIVRRVPT